MKHPLRMVLGIAALLGVAAHAAPAWAACPFSSPIQQGGLLGRPIGFLALPHPSAAVGGFFWELGFGHPAASLGNDGDPTITGIPVGLDSVWIRRDLTPTPTVTIDWDWGLAGTDGCPSGGAGSGVVVFYILDDAVSEDYALLAVTGTPAPDGTPSHDLDLITTAFGDYGNQVPLVPLGRGVLPLVTVTEEIDDFDVVADVAPLIFPGAARGLNLHTDLGVGLSYSGLLDTSGVTLIRRDPGGGNETPVPGCPPDTGCTGVTLARDQEYCWDGFVEVVAGGGTCDNALQLRDPHPGNSCITDADCAYCSENPFDCSPGSGNETCFGGFFGTCLPDLCGSPATFGPSISVAGACVRIVGPAEAHDGDFVIDCDETTLSRGWHTPEVCDGIDNDCDVIIDEGLTVDADGDGFTTPGSCFGSADDCDDGNPISHPGAAEVCDGLDNDCNAVVDDPFDLDGDGFSPCTAPPDCDEANPDRFPGNPEICDNVDNDCNGAVDEGFDLDGDGFTTCALPVPDCDDGAPERFPGNPEVCDGLDNDCDGVLPPFDTDADGDGFAPCDGDCDDENASISPGPEVNDGLDNDCPGNLGFGLIDEISGDAGFHNPADPDEYSWDPQAGATLYQVARASSPDFSTDCVTSTTTGTFAVAGSPPLGIVSYRLVRTLTPNLGSWGKAAGALPGAERFPPCASP